MELTVCQIPFTCHSNNVITVCRIWLTRSFARMVKPFIFPPAITTWSTTTVTRPRLIQWVGEVKNIHLDGANKESIEFVVRDIHKTDNCKVELYRNEANIVIISVHFPESVEFFCDSMHCLVHDSVAHPFVKTEVFFDHCCRQSTEAELLTWNLLSMKTANFTKPCTIFLSWDYSLVVRARRNHTLAYKQPDIFTVFNNYRKFFIGLSTSASADVTFAVGDSVFRAHRAIMASQSSVFHAMFSINMAENQSGVVKIVDVEPSAWQDLLRFVYTGLVIDIHKKPKFWCWLIDTIFPNFGVTQPFVHTRC